MQQLQVTISHWFIYQVVAEAATPNIKIFYLFIINYLYLCIIFPASLHLSEDIQHLLAKDICGKKPVCDSPVSLFSCHDA